MVTTRSGAKRAEKLGQSSSESKCEEFKKKTLEDWLENTYVMDNAKEIWKIEIFRPKQILEDPALNGTLRLRYLGDIEWDSLPDSEKLPFVAKALESLIPKAKSATRHEKIEEFAKRHKKTKGDRAMDLLDARNNFLKQYCRQYFMWHDDYRPTVDAYIDGYKKWTFLSDDDKAEHFAEVERMRDHHDEFIKYFQNEEASINL